MIERPSVRQTSIESIEESRLTPGVRKSRDQAVAALALDRNAQWTHDLRQVEDRVRFVSFALVASDGTEVSLCGARFRVAPSPAQGFLRLEVPEDREGKEHWVGVGIHVPARNRNSAEPASFGVLTIRVSPVDGFWDVYHGPFMIATALSLTSRETRASALGRQLVIRAGRSGARLSDIVECSANPIYEDEDLDGIDDLFASTQPDGLLRTDLVDRWRAHQHVNRPVSFLVEPPQPIERRGGPAR